MYLVEFDYDVRVFAFYHCVVTPLMLCVDLCFCSSSWLDVHRVRYCRTTLLPCGCQLLLTNSLCTSFRSARSLTSSVPLVLFVRCVSLVHVFWISGFNPSQSRVAVGRQWLTLVKEGLVWFFALGCSVVVLFISSLSLGLGSLQWQVSISSSLLLMYQLSFFSFYGFVRLTWINL